MLASGLITSRRLVRVRTTPKHRSTHISNHQSSEHKSNQHDESNSMKFPCTLKNTLLIIRDRFGLPFASKGLGYLAAYLLLLSLLVTNYLAIKLLATYNFSTCRHYLTENYLSFPSAPRWVRHKSYNWFPILVGHQGYFMAPLPESGSPLVSGIW